MPEGDTVWNTARMLDRALAGTVVDHSDLRVPRLATVELSGWLVNGCASRGKHLLLRLTPPAADTGPADPAPAKAMPTPPGARSPRIAGERPVTLHSHLRMDGHWQVYRPGVAWRGGPAHLIRAVLRTGSAVAVGYHLHELSIVATDEEARLVGHLGPDLLGSPDEPGGWDRAEAVRRLREHPDQPIAEALLEQRNLAGIGNLYKAETLFLRGLNPWALVSTVDDLEAVVDLARALLRSNRGRATQATTGSLRRGQEVYVYGRAGAPCRRCGTPIARADQGERVTYWCPRCQPPP